MAGEVLLLQLLNAQRRVAAPARKVAAGVVQARLVQRQLCLRDLQCARVGRGVGGVRLARLQLGEPLLIAPHRLLGVLPPGRVLDVGFRRLELVRPLHRDGEGGVHHLVGQALRLVRQSALAGRLRQCGEAGGLLIEPFIAQQRPQHTGRHLRALSRHRRGPGLCPFPTQPAEGHGDGQPRPKYPSPLFSRRPAHSAIVSGFATPRYRAHSRHCPPEIDRTIPILDS
jgi:hypothetical protein